MGDSEECLGLRLVSSCTWKKAGWNSHHLDEQKPDRVPLQQPQCQCLRAKDGRVSSQRDELRIDRQTESQGSLVKAW